MSLVIFSNRKKRLLARIDGIQRYLDNQSSGYLSGLEIELKQELDSILNWEELLWYQKSRADQIKWSDRNTAYFHAKTIARRQRNRIELLQDDYGAWIDNQDELKMLASSYFQNLYTEDNMSYMEYQIKDKFTLLPSDSLSFLSKVVDAEEVCTSLFDTNPWKAPGLDSFQAGFFQTQWDIVGKDFCDEVFRIRQEGILENGLNHTLIL